METLSVTSAQFFCEPNTDLKTNCLLKKLQIIDLNLIIQIILLSTNGLKA